MELALIYGFFSSATRGPYDVRELSKHDLTGSESFFFNCAAELAALGHKVTAYGFWKESFSTNNIRWIKYDTSKPDNAPTAAVFKFAQNEVNTYDAAIAWNEPDYLSVFPDNVLRVCVQQLNDFSYCRTQYAEFTDLYLFPSQVHLEHMLRTHPVISRDKCKVFSNCLNSQTAIQRVKGTKSIDRKKMIYCSSPDRGLHWVADMFESIKAAVPDATLDVYYRYQPWYESYKNHWDPSSKLFHEMGMRARYCQEFFDRFGTKGENGVRLMGPVSSTTLAEALCQAGVLFYPCDTVIFTEGFGVSILDACYAGVVPVISSVDALGDVYRDVAEIVPGRPSQQNRQEWIDRVVRVLTDDQYAYQAIKRCEEFAAGFTVQNTVQKLLSLNFQ